MRGFSISETWKINWNILKGLQKLRDIKKAPQRWTWWTLNMRWWCTKNLWTSRFQMSNKTFYLMILYTQFSMSIKSSLTCEFNNPILMPARKSRVCWNRSSTASHQGEILNEGQSRWIKCENSNRGSAYLAKVLELANSTIPFLCQSALRVCWNQLSTASPGGEIIKLGEIGLSSC